MNPKQKQILSFIASAIVLVGGFAVAEKYHKISQPSGVPSVLGAKVTDPFLGTRYDTQFLGLWVDPHKDNSYYAYQPTLSSIDGKLYLTACTSGKTVVAGTPPDWTSGAKQASDYIRQWSSADNGSSWSSAQILIKARQTSPGQDDLLQNGCTNSPIFFKNRYYLFFESASPPTDLVAIHVARSSSPAGPYEVLTKKGWQSVPTKDEWKPVLRPEGLRNDPKLSKQAFFKGYKDKNQGNQYWGAGVPWVTQKDGKIYLYYTDTSRYVCNLKFSSSPCKEISTVKDGKTIYGIPYSMVAVSTDPMNFEKESAIRETTQGDVNNPQLNTKWRHTTARYFPDSKIFTDYFIQAGEKNSFGPSVMYQTSVDGINFTDAQFLSAIPKQIEVEPNADFHGHIVRKIGQDIAIQGDKYGQGSMKNLKFATVVSALLNPAWGWETSYPQIFGLQLVPPSSLVPVVSRTSREMKADGASNFIACGKNYGLAPYARVKWPNAKNESDYIWYYPGGPLQYSYYTDKNTLEDCFSVPLDKGSAGYLEYLRTSGTGTTTIEIVNQPGGESTGHISSPIPMNPLGDIGY